MATTQLEDLLARAREEARKKANEAEREAAREGPDTGG